MVSRGGEVYVYNGIDRLDSSKGYVLENCVPCCSEINWAKRVMSFEDFVTLCVEVAEKHGKTTHATAV
jgi:hypothetical protein